jgi:hypothetical protein
MSKKDLVAIVSRGVALYFFAWACDNVTYVPGEIRSLSHHVSERSVLTMDQYWRNGDIWSMAFTLSRAAFLFAVAIWLFHCGPSVERFLLPPESPE